MRMFFFILIVFVALTSAQTFRVESVKPLTTPEEGQYFFPTVGPDGETVYFTGMNYTGLYARNMKSGSIVTITEDPGAGYNPVISEDGEMVYYRTYQYKGMRRYSSLISYDQQDRRKQTLESEVRDLSFPILTPDGHINYTVDSKLKAIASAGLSEQHGNGQGPVVYIERRKIILYTGDERKELEPLGPGIYVWPSLSPQGDRLLFTKGGEGTFVTDLDGNILSELGMANAPKWSPDGNWIVYMDDKDDGHQILSSEIFVVKSDGSERIKLTDTTDKIEMYPSWGTDNSTLVYALDRGQIMIMRLINE